jgi:MFS family permease
MSVAHSPSIRTSSSEVHPKDDSINKETDVEKSIGEQSEELASEETEKHHDAALPHQPKQSILQRVVTGRSLSSRADPGPPPDGGLQAWLTAVAGLCVVFNSWGYIQTFGVFQTYYVTALNESQSTISWIGSIQIFLLFFLGPFSGRATDAGYFRPVLVSGLFMQLLGVFMTSLATKYWHVFLAQGVCQGIGNGLQFVPTMSLVSTYFDKNRSFAIGLTAVGAAIGGLIMPAMVQQLLPKIGYGWTVRALGLVIAVLGITAAIILKTRIPPRKAGPLFEWAAFKEPPFLCFCIAMFLNFWGVYFPFIYVSILE